MAKNSSLLNWEKRRRFLRPLKQGKHIAIRYSLTCSLRPIFWIFSIIMIEAITKDIELWNKEHFLTSLIIFLAWSIIIHLTWILLRNKWWPTSTTLLNICTYEPTIRQILWADNTKFERLWTWKIMAIMQSGLDTRNRLLTDFIKNGSILTITGCFTLYLMYRINFWFILVFIFILIAVSVIVIYANDKTIVQRNVSRDLKNERTRKFVKIIMSKFEILQSNKIDYEIDALKKNTNDRYLSEKKRSLVTELVFKTPEFWWFIIRFLIFMIIWYGIFWWKFTYAELVMFSWALSLIDGVISNFVNFYFDFTSRFNELDKLWETLDNLTVKQNFNTNADSFKFRHWNISLKSVDFMYYKTKVFDNFSIKIPWWKTTALVWESGGWKTTLIKLLAWYISPNNWYVYVDNQDINKINKIEYYKHIWYLPQEPSVFDGTIHENLVYALNYEPTQQQLKDVIRLSKCEFIREFKDWLETEIWERWILLSGGQKQRLAIAKIMLKNPDIVLLDEPTAALDSINEEQISIALNNLFKNKTVVVIAHRLQTVKNADKIFFLEEWKIIEEWTHRELIKLNWKYKKMLDLQSGF